MLAGADVAARTPGARAHDSFTDGFARLYIEVGDVLEVRLLLNPELNEEVTVRPDGHISTTAVPDMLAYGRSPVDLADLLRAVYARDLQNPRVSVVVKSFAPTRVYVAGEVTTSASSSLSGRPLHYHRRSHGPGAPS